MTSYLVFRKTEEETWDYCGKAPASSADGAIRTVLSGPGTEFERSGRFVATPERSWKVVDVVAEQTVKLSFNGAS